MSRANRYSAAVLSTAIAALSNAGLDPSLSTAASVSRSTSRTVQTSSATTPDVNMRETADASVARRALTGTYTIVESSQGRALSYDLKIKNSEGTRLGVAETPVLAVLSEQVRRESVRSGTVTSSL